MRSNCVASEVSASLCTLDQQWMDDEFDCWRDEKTARIAGEKG